jgi:UDP-glucose-4-epimerase GalE
MPDKINRAFTLTYPTFPAIPPYATVRAIRKRYCHREDSRRSGCTRALENPTMKHVLVAGGAGYIGSHTAKALALAGFGPVVLDNLSYGHRWAVKWGPLYVGDIADIALVTEIVHKHKIEAVVHLAAHALVGESMTNPCKYFHNNAFGSLRMFDALKQSGVRNVVFSSTCATYGDPVRVPIDETHTQIPVNPYGESKLFVEKMLRWYGEAYNMRSVCLRYFNAAGADPDGEIGEDHEPETHLIPLVILAALTQKARLRIFGTDYPTPDGTAIRDYIHVADLSAAHVQAIRYLLDGGTSIALNLGTGNGNSVHQVVRTVEKVSGATVPVVEESRRAGDPAILVAQADKAREALDWIPRFVEIEETIQTAWEWHASRVPAAVE